MPRPASPETADWRAELLWETGVGPRPAGLVHRPDPRKRPPPRLVAGEESDDPDGGPVGPAHGFEGADAPDEADGGPCAVAEPVVLGPAPVVPSAAWVQAAWRWEVEAPETRRARLLAEHRRPRPARPGARTDLPRTALMRQACALGIGVFHLPAGLRECLADMFRYPVQTASWFLLPCLLCYTLGPLGLVLCLLWELSEFLMVGRGACEMGGGACDAAELEDAARLVGVFYGDCLLELLLVGAGAYLGLSL